MLHASLAGQLPDFDLPQIISLLEYSRMSGHLKIMTPDQRGLLQFDDGRVNYAEGGGATGELAAYLMLSWTEGNFIFTRGTGGRPSQPIRSNQSLVLEAMRLMDECRKTDGAFAASETVAWPSEDVHAQLILSHLDRPAHVDQIAAACSLTALEVYYHLDRLERAGAVARRQRGASDILPITRTAPRGEQPARILVVDDSPLMQKVLRVLYESDPLLTVVGTAANGWEALDLLPRLKPDLVSLDLYMPGLDGLSTLRHIMLGHPTPTVIVTSANPEALDLTFESILRFGAIDFITKPSRSRGDLAGQTASILQRARKAARVNLRGLRMVQPPAPEPAVRAERGHCRGVLVASSGTGGCLSYLQFLPSLPPDLPYAVVGGLPFSDEFLRAFVTYLRKIAPFDIEVAEPGTQMQSGVCYLVGLDHEVRLLDGPFGPVLDIREATGPPKLTPLMMDVARLFGPRSVGLVLSGEGEEALPGIAVIHAEGGITLAQLPASCVDPEQPERAIDAGVVDRVVLPSHISGSLTELLMTRHRRATSEAVEEDVVSLWPERRG